MVSNRASTEALATGQMIPSGTEIHQQWYRPSGSNQTMILILVRTTRVSGITFFRYARDQKVGKPNTKNVMSIKTKKDLNRTAKIS